MIFAAIVALAFAIEAALGFGGTLVAVSLGALFFPVEVILPALVPLNMALSSVIAVRERSAIDWRELTRRVLPWMTLGLPVGLLAFRAIDLRLALGIVLVALALMSLSIKVTAHRPLLIAAGIVHGALGTGGPLVVAALGNRLDKRAFRATLQVLWLILNSVLLVGFVFERRLDLMLTAQGLVGVLVGGAVGELVFRRLGNFHRVIWAALLVTGVVLIIKQL